MPCALDIPEIRHHVGTYLCNRDLINCACVSREWNTTFSRQLWDHTVIKSLCRYQPASNPNVPLGQVQAHSGQIRALTLKMCIPSEYFQLTNLSRLQSIHVKYRRHVGGPAPPLLANLIKNHSSTLVNIQIDYECSSFHLSIVEAIMMCQHLKSLSLNRVKLNLEELTHLLVACAKVGQGTGEVGTDATPERRVGGLTTLCLEGSRVRHSDLDLSHTLPPLSHLKHLRVTTMFCLSCDSKLRILALCPNIKSLSLGRSMFGQQFPVNQWAERQESGMWPLLTSLDVSCEEFCDEVLSRFINNSLSPLEKLLVRRTGFGLLAYNSMISAERHYNHIQELDVYECEGVTGQMIQKFMTTMPALSYLSAGRLRATDIFDAPGMDPNGDDHGQEWVCKNIHTLKLCIDMGEEFGPTSPEYADRQRHLYRRLSELKSLKILDMGRKFSIHVVSADGAIGGQYFRLSAGLEQLASLIRLKECFFGPQQYLNLKEVEWMMRTLKLLEVVATFMKDDPGFVDGWTKHNEQVYYKIVSKR